MAKELRRKGERIGLTKDSTGQRRCFWSALKMCKEQIVEICGIREQVIVERKYNLEEEARSWSHIREKEWFNRLRK